jgi:UDP-N-acetylglucosamine 4,6-dehydratase/5-epimerase
VNETILIVGGTGSFGRAFVATLLADPAWDGRLIAMARNSEMRYRMEQAHLDAVHGGRLRVVPGDVRQPSDLARLADEGVDTVIHAAAEKHIGTGEKWKAYTRSVNYGGACNVRDFALAAGVKRVLALSTDKACPPIANYYGWTKAAAERMFVRANGRGTTRFSCVRYGNIINSSGSVLPLFLEQRKGGRLTLTDPHMTRFAMPSSDDAAARVTTHDGPVISAVGLVRWALANMRGGEMFVPRIPGHRVVALAQCVGKDCEIEIIGVRPGERLYEALIAPEESPRTWTVPGMGWVILPSEHDTWPGGERVPAGFSFRSDTDPLPVQWVEVA